MPTDDDDDDINNSIETKSARLRYFSRNWSAYTVPPAFNTYMSK